MSKCFCCAKNITSDCFLVCKDCNCFAHESCMDFYTFNCGNIDIPSKKIYINCPLCKKELPSHEINKNNITKEMYVSNIQSILNNINRPFTDIPRKIALLHTLFNLLIESKNILLKEGANLTSLVERKLKELYHNEHWQSAEYYYQKLFDKDINI